MSLLGRDAINSPEAQSQFLHNVHDLNSLIFQILSESTCSSSPSIPVCIIIFCLHYCTAFICVNRLSNADPFPSAMGKSRSVTIILAYLLRQYPHHTVSSALSLVRESRPMAEPNDGFMAQLELYKAMGCPRDIDAHPKYQRWLYQREVDLAVAAGMVPDRVRFEDEETQEETEASGREVELRCRKCRYVLTTSSTPA